MNKSKKIELKGQKMNYILNSKPDRRNHHLCAFYIDNRKQLQQPYLIQQLAFTLEGKDKQDVYNIMKNQVQQIIQYDNKQYLVMKNVLTSTLADQLLSINKSSIVTRQEELSIFLTKIASFIKDMNTFQKRPKILTVLDPTIITMNVDQEQQSIFDVSCIPTQKSRKQKHVHRGIWYLPPQSKWKENCVLTFTSKSNVWCFGAILYECLSRGEKFIDDERAYQKVFDPNVNPFSVYEDIFNDRMNELQFRLTNEDSINNMKRLFDIAKKCLTCQESKRYTIQALHYAIGQTIQSSLALEQLPSKTANQVKIKIVVNLCFEYFRLKFIYVKINQIFSALPHYYVPVNLKISTYISLKLISLFYEQRFCWAQEKVQRLRSKVPQILYQLFSSRRQYQQVKASRQKMSQYISKILTSIPQDNPFLKDIQPVFPQINDQQVYQAHKVAYQFCYRYSSLICQKQDIAILLSQCLEASLSRNDYKILHYKQFKLKKDNLWQWTIGKMKEWWSDREGKEYNYGNFMKQELSEYLQTIGVKEGSLRHLKYYE